ncbi:MAG: histidinol dehydrogenase [Candidatus Latescibacterota bacterium]|jgi:histidinol dehydrogenase
MKTIRRPPPADWPDLSVRPEAASAPAIEDRVREILNDVRQNGDAAVRRLTHEIDGVSLDDLRVEKADIDAAVAEIDSDLKTAIQTAIRNVKTFHESQMPVDATVEIQPGITCWRRRTPITPIGIYVPGGTAPLFSTTVMLAVPAKIAGCRNMVLCTPPSADGSVHPVILATAGILGLTTVFKIGGAQAIGAMAYGTESVPRVNKIFGPGNSWVTTAKRFVSSKGIPIDLPAGPTELLILADESADIEFVAADVLAQAEHGPDSQVVVVTWSNELSNSLPGEIDRQLKDLPRRDIAEKAVENSRLVVLDDADEAVAFANEYAPEHLSLQCSRANYYAKLIENAGSVFVGHLTPEALGDYASGTNHTLPTSGYARAWGGVSVDSFCKYITFQRASADGLKALGPIVETLAVNESLDGHARSVRIRLENVERPTSDSDSPTSDSASTSVPRSGADDSEPRRGGPPEQAIRPPTADLRRPNPDVSPPTTEDDS